MKPQCVTNQMKAIERYTHVILFVMLYKVDETLVCDQSNKAIERYTHDILFVMLYKVDETLVCDQSNESYRTVHSRDIVCYAVQGR